jgi:anti-sigma factor RsiW
MAVNCSDIKVLLQDYVTRELAAERRAEVDAHLVECPDCQRELALTAALVSTLDNQPVLEPPPDFTARVIRRLPGRRPVMLSPWWALAAAPVLGLVAWLVRAPVLRLITPALERLGPGGVGAGARLPEVGYAQLTWVALGWAVLAAAVVAGGAYFGWRLVRGR